MMAAMEPREGFENFEVPEPMPAKRGSRTPTLITAAVVLVVAGLLNLLVVAAFDVSGSRVFVHLTLGGVQIAGAALVLARQPVGRVLGVVLGILGIGLGIAGASGDAVSALMAVLLNAYVVYAMAVSGPAFRRN